MQKKSIFLLLLLVILINGLPITEARDPKVSVANGLEIRQPMLRTLEPGETIELPFHIDSKETGLALTAADTFFCELHLYNENNSHIWVVRKDQTDLDHNYDIEFLPGTNNFTEEGEYWYNLYCECSACAIVAGFTDLGGWATEIIMVIDPEVLGEEISTAESLMYILILLVLVLLSLIGIYLSVKIPYKNIEEETKNGKIVRAITFTKYAKLIVIWFTSGIMLTFLTILTGMINNYVQFVEMKTLFTNTYTYISILSYGLSTLIMIILFVSIYKDLLWNSEIKKHGKAFIEKYATSH